MLAPVSQITPDGLPVLLIENAPPEVKTAVLKLTRPELYYGEVTHEPVFVHTAQRRVQLSQRARTTSSRATRARAAFPSPRFGMRAGRRHQRRRAEHPADQLSDRRQPHDDPPQGARPAAAQLAGFLAWDTDPYLVITDEGRLVWMVDGYTTSDAHPYSRRVDVPRYGRRELHPQRREGHRRCLRRRDAHVRLRARRPDHSRPTSGSSRDSVPALLARCRPICGATRAIPETLFRVQAEIYRTYHMLDPQAFYNKEDVWDLARHTTGAGAAAPSR